jgi:hypothetical protein
MASVTRHRYVAKWVIPLMAVGMIVGLPVWLPLVGVWDVVRKRRMRRAADAFACVNCGKTLGINALKRADSIWAEHLRALIRDHPDVKFRIVRTLDAICTACGTRYTYVPAGRTFERVLCRASDEGGAGGCAGRR